MWASGSGNASDEELEGMLILGAAEEEEESELTWREQLNEDGRARRERHIPRESLLPPDKSPWSRLYHSKNDSALITITGFDHETFQWLLELFTPLFYGFTPWVAKDGYPNGSWYRKLEDRGLKGGRKRIIRPHSCLGLVLAWYRFRGSEYILQGWFGFTGSHANVWLKFGRRMLFKALKDVELARPEWPDHPTINSLKAIVVAKYPALKDVYCVADGLKQAFEACADLDEQSMYYNGWTHGHYISSLFVFGLDGRIIKCVLNVPGSIHDSTMCEWGNVYGELNEIYKDTGGKCCVDSAFNATNAPYLLKSAQTVHKANNELEVLQFQQATSVRQAAEWGMRAIQSAFPRMKDMIRYEEEGLERKLMLKLMVLLYNVRLELVGLNQIRNTYVPQWSRDADDIISSV